MKIRTKLSIWFTFITASILLLFAAIIYLSAEKNRETEFYHTLRKEAITKANLYFNTQIDAATLQAIYKNNRETLYEVEVAIYDTLFHLHYHDAEEIDFVEETQQMMGEVLQLGEIRFYQNDWQIIGLKYAHEGQNYMITAAAYDQDGYNELKSLSKNIALVFIISIIFIYVAGRFFSKKAFEPVTEMTDKAKSISATNLDLRINAYNSKDELSGLANTFNEMLSRLENSFDAQKQFVSNISHELRTPLSAMIAELELCANRDRSKDEYKKVIENVLSDARKLTKLSTTLLDFAKASYEASEIHFEEVRLDEILLDAQQQLSRMNSEYKISIHFEKEMPDDMINSYGNEYLLRTAFVNIMENGCKFSSDKHCDVTICYLAEKILITFSDNGIGIPEEDLPHIFTPFYRGKNQNNTYGKGIGLSLMHKIVSLHKGSVSVNSARQRGTTFRLTFPAIQSL